MRSEMVPAKGAVAAAAREADMAIQAMDCLPPMSAMI